MICPYSRIFYYLGLEFLIDVSTALVELLQKTIVTDDMRKWYLPTKVGT